MDITGASILVGIVVIVLLYLLRKPYRCSSCGFASYSARKALAHAQGKHTVE